MIFIETFIFFTAPSHAISKSGSGSKDSTPSFRLDIFFIDTDRMKIGPSCLFCSYVWMFLGTKHSNVMKSYDNDKHQCGRLDTELKKGVFAKRTPPGNGNSGHVFCFHFISSCRCSQSNEHARGVYP